MLFMIERPTGTAVPKIAFALIAHGVISWNPICAAAENEPIAIGAVLPLTGEAAHWGIPPRNAAELAIDEINVAGGIGGREVKMLVAGERCRPADGASAFTQIMRRAP